MLDLMPWMAPWGRLGIALALLVFGLLITAYALLHDRARGRPRCPRCWYNATGLPSRRCPECGHEVESEQQRYRTRRSYRLAVVGLLVAFTLPSLVITRRVHEYGWGYYLTYGPLYWLLPRVKEQSLTIESYTITLDRDRRERWPSRLRITRAGRVLFEEKQWCWLIGGGFEDALSVPVGHDLNGNGIADLIISNHTGGAHCCATYYLFELDLDELRSLGVIHAAHGLQGFKDIDGDGTVEIIVHDWSFAYWHASFAGSPAPRVILRWDGQAFVPSSELMNKPPPPEAHLAAEAKQVHDELARRQTFVDYTPLWWMMLELIYSGHPQLGYEFLDRAWPEALAGKDEFRREFDQNLALSPYSPALAK
jgi:hypothetical protein